MNKNIMNILSFPFKRLKPEDTIENGIKMLRLTKLDTLPVVDEDNRLIGVFTKSQAYDAILYGCSLQKTLKGHVITDALTVQSSWEYDRIVKQVKETRVGTGIVIDEHNKACGVFTKIDMIREALKKEELLNKKLKAIYSSMHNGLISFDSYGQIDIINENACKVLGVSQDEVTGEFIGTLLPTLEIAEYTFKQKQEVSKKIDYKTAKLILNISPIIQSDKVVGGLVIFQDITDLEDIAGELESVKKLYKAFENIIEGIHDGIFVTNEHGVVTFVNTTFVDFFATDKQSILNKPSNKFLDNDKIQEVIKTGIETNSIQQIRGNSFFVSYKPIIKNNQTLGVMGRIICQQEMRSLYSSIDALEELEQLNHSSKKAEKQTTFSLEDIVSNNPNMNRLKKTAMIISKGSSSIIIYGESGTGKEVMAQSIHNSSFRSKGPFLKVNCAAIPENLLESEFFGYESGAFSGANKNGKPGKFELANNGTFFLDEIGDMSLNLQAKLLRVLEDYTFERIGGSKSITVDVRVIAATNQNLLEKVQNRTFREDLYFRLNVIPLNIPPLRERKEDIFPLCYLFIKKFNSKLSRNISLISDDAKEILYNHDWPGNVRELENTIEYSINFATDVIDVNHLPAYLLYKKNNIEAFETNLNTNLKSPLNEFENADENFENSYYNLLFQKEKEIIINALLSSKGNKSEAANILGISRSWLYKKMKKLNIK